MVRRVARAAAIVLYWILTRTTVFVALLCTTLFFVVNSSPFPGRLSAALRAVLPGTLEWGHLQFSPIPGRVDMLDVRIRTSTGGPAVDAGELLVTMDLLPMLEFFLGNTDNRLELRFDSVRLKDFHAEIAFDEHRHLKFLDAFVWPPRPEAADAPAHAGPRTEVPLVFRRVMGENGSCRVAFSEWEVLVQEISLEANLTVAGNGHTTVRSPDLSFTRGMGRIHAAPDVEVIPRVIPMGPGRVQGFVYDFDRIAYDRAVFDLDGVRLDARDGRLAFPSHAPLAYSGSALLEAPEGSPVVETASAGIARGPLEIRVSGEGDDHDPRFSLEVSSPALSVAGHPLGETVVRVRGGRDANGAYAFSDLSIDAKPVDGTVRIRDAVIHPFGVDPASDDPAKRAFRAVLDATIRDVDPARVLAHLELPVPPDRFSLRSIREAALHVLFTIEPGPSARADLDVEASVAGPLPPRSILDGRDASIRLATHARFEGDGSAPVLDVRELSVRAGRDSARVRGTLRLSDRTINVTGSLDKDVATLLDGLGGPRGEGRLALSGIRARGPLLAPVASARIEGTGLAFGDWTADSVAASATWKNGELDLADLEAKAPYATLTAARLKVRTPAAPRGPAKGVHLSLERAEATAVDLARLPPLRGAGLRGRGKVAVPQLSLSTAAPFRTIEGAGSATFPNLVVGGKTLRKTDVAVSVRDGRVTIDRASAALAGGGTVGIGGSLAADGRSSDLTFAVSEVPLPALAGMSQDGPLTGVVGLAGRVAGSLSNPRLEARLVAGGVSYGELQLGDLEVDVLREPGQDLHVSSDRFLPKIRLNPESGLLWENGSFTGLVLMLDINRLTPQDLYPPLRPRDFWAQLTGNLQVRIGFGSAGRLEAALTSPPDGLRLAFFDREVILSNHDRLVLSIERDGAVTVSGLSLGDGTGTLSACGEVIGADGRTHLLLAGDVGLYWLRALKDVFSSAQGWLTLSGPEGAPATDLPLGCQPGTFQGAPFVVRGDLSHPLADGMIVTGDLDATLRRYPDPIHIDAGGRILFRTRDGKVSAEVASGSRLRGSLGEGSLAVWGRTVFDGFLPDTGEVQVSGASLRFVSPGEFYAVLDPKLKGTFRGLAQPGAASVELSGQIALTEGSYHKNFDLMRQAFSTFTGGRVAERSTQPITTRFPWLADAALDIALTGPRFGVRSRLPVGSTDLDLAVDLQLKGTIANPELWNRIEVLPGGKVYYDVVRREFEVVRGTIDFLGAPGRPIADVTARTRVDYASGATTQSTTGNRYTESATDAGWDEDAIMVTLRVSGRYPDVDIGLTSNSQALDQSDLKYLLITGMTPREAAQGDAKSVINLGILTEDMTNLLTKMLLSPIVDAIRFGVSPSGGVNAEVMAHMGTRLKFETQVLQDQTGSQYTAGFQVKLTDRLSLEGRLRSIEEPTDTSGPRRVYESKLRYRIPID